MECTDKKVEQAVNAFLEKSKIINNQMTGKELKDSFDKYYEDWVNMPCHDFCRNLENAIENFAKKDIFIELQKASWSNDLSTLNIKVKGHLEWIDIHRFSINPNVKSVEALFYQKTQKRYGAFTFQNNKIEYSDSSVVGTFPLNFAEIGKEYLEQNIKNKNFCFDFSFFEAFEKIGSDLESFLTELEYKPFPIGLHSLKSIINNKETKEYFELLALKEDNNNYTYFQKLYQIINNNNLSFDF